MSDDCQLDKCPKCGGTIRCVDTRSKEEGKIRKRACLQCGRMVETGEHILRVINEGAEVRA